MKSMTAYANQEFTSPLAQIGWEIRAVNQRYLETFFKLPEAWRHLEMTLRDVLKTQVSRGKIEITLKLDTDASTEWQLNQEMVMPLKSLLLQLENQFPSLNAINPLELLKWPGLVKNKALSSAENQQLETEILQSFQETLGHFNQARANEGAQLKAILLNKAEAIEMQIEQVLVQLPERLNQHTEKLKGRLQELIQSSHLEEQRLLQEVALLAQKLDVQEELDRLKSHLQTLHQILTENQPMGRRLDFLMQEMNREANTLGSKSLDIVISQASVELKVLIEQIREQVQNIE